jgi:3-oxoadipate enol-lactonase
VRLYAEEHGDGHPLLLLTGLGYAIWSWRRQLPEWSQHFRCIAVENRGTGRSPKPPGPTSIEEMADDAAEMLGGRRAHVCGYSMGGYLAQALALRHPDLVDRLVLVCTATGGPDVAPTPAETRETGSRTPTDRLPSSREQRCRCRSGGDGPTSIRMSSRSS